MHVLKLNEFERLEPLHSQPSNRSENHKCNQKETSTYFMAHWTYPGAMIRSYFYVSLTCQAAKRVPHRCTRQPVLGADLKVIQLTIRL